MKSTLSIFLVLALPFAGLTQNKKVAQKTTSYTIGAKKVTVYTTAQNTDYRIRKTETVSFVENKQPFETEPCIFVDPVVKYQTLVGIGGALTDASAETFAKLSKKNQQELLKSYYSVNEEIGYTLA